MKFHTHRGQTEGGASGSRNLDMSVRSRNCNYLYQNWMTEQGYACRTRIEARGCLVVHRPARSNRERANLAQLNMVLTSMAKANSHTEPDACTR